MITVPEEIILSNGSKWNQWRKVHESTKYRFCGVDLSNHSFAEYDLSDVLIENSTLNSTSFNRARVSNTHLKDCRGVSVTFEVISSLIIEQCYLGRVSFTDTSIEKCQLHSVEIRDSNFPYLANTSGHWTNVTFIQCTFERIRKSSSLANTRFDTCIFEKTNFDSIELFGSLFRASEFRNVSLVGALFDDGTRFENIAIKGAQIERYYFEMIKDQGFKMSHHLNLKIIDPVASMRQSFSGIMHYIHTLALLVFIAPYVIFLAVNYVRAQFVTEGIKTVTLASKFWQYVVTAGTYDATIHTSHLILISFLLLYNANRALLVWKTKMLELEQEATGLPSAFRLCGFWKAAKLFSKYGFFANLVVVAWHSVNLLQLGVPTSQVKSIIQ